MKIGLRAHDVRIFDDIEKLAKKLNDLGIDYIQFAPRASLPQITDNGRNINFGLANNVRKVLASYDIQIAVLGCYINIIHPNITERTAALDLFKRYLITAKYFDSNLVATETGSVDPDFHLTSKNYEPGVIQLAIQQVQELVHTAEKLGNLVGIEPGVNHPIHNLDVMSRLLQEINSPNLQVIVDPANLVTTQSEDITDVIQQALSTFENQIYCYHIKDYIIEEGRAKIVPIGEGIANIQPALSLIEKSQPEAFVILDETPSMNFERSLTRIQKMLT